MVLIRVHCAADSGATASFELPARFPGATLACFSHAASLGLVAALTRRRLEEVGKFAPCGIFKLVSSGDGAWSLEWSGGDNSGHVTSNSPETYPWGFPASYADVWDEARRLGPPNSELFSLDADF